MQPWTMGAPWAGIGIVLVGIAVLIFSSDSATTSWPTADGVVTSSRLETNTVQTKDQAGYLRYRESRVPKVSYHYTVDGRQLEGSRITREPRADDHGDAVVAQYPVGKAVKVYYDPKDPASSVLERKTSIGGVIFAAIGGFFLLFGVAMFVALKYVVNRSS
jgi:hypothetical protein